MVVRAEFETFPAKAGRSPRVNLVPALAGFQSEHEVEIPFMLTSEEDEG